MNIFLQQLAKYYYNKYGSSIKDFCFVFPGRRSGLFFTQYLNLLISEPIWAPDVISYNNFISLFSSTPTADKLTLTFELYQEYIKLYNTDISFDEFIQWGEIILSDFEDIDKYLADAKDVFTNVYDYKQLDDDFSHLTPEQIKIIQSFWRSFDPQNKSFHKSEFLNIWSKLYDLYLLYNKRLKAKNISYSGAACRQVVDKIQNEGGLDIKYSKIIFVSFNALDIAQKKIFSHFQNKGIGEFIWDLDLKMFSQDENLKQNEATRFIKENIIQYPMPSDWNPLVNASRPNIEVISFASDTAQTQMISQLLNEWDSEKNNTFEYANKTAVVLTDESLLMPVLYSVPEQYSEINITMGYPLKNTPAYALPEIIFKLIANSRKKSDGTILFFYRDVLSLLTHQYIELINKELFSEIISDITAGNLIYVSNKIFEQDKFLFKLFNLPNKNDSVAEYLKGLLFDIYNKLSEDEENNHVLEKEFIYNVYLIITELTDILKKLNLHIKNDTFIRFYRRIAEGHSIPFSGEPLRGLQVMGILETRALDFQNIIITNVEEGVFPESSKLNSYIPYSLRVAFGLPVTEHHDAMYAYYFYRLLQRSENVYLLYNSSSQNNRSGEMSRFIFQLKYEYPNEIKFSSASDTVNTLISHRPIAEKTDRVMNVLEQYTDKGSKILSPSALSTYITCPLQFYYKYIILARESDVITDEIDLRYFGNIFHRAIELLYENYKNKEVSPDIIRKFIDDKKYVNSCVDKAFGEYFKSSVNDNDLSSIHGKLSLVIDIIKKYIYYFLKNEKQNAPFKIIDLEKSVKASYSIDNYVVNLGGSIDRLDQKDDVVRVIDYKTGKTKKSFKNVEDLFLQSNHKDLKAIFQTLLYAKILKKNGQNLRLKPEVVDLRNIFNSKNNDLMYNKDILFLDEVENEYDEQLKIILNDLFNKETPFVATEKIDYCDFCSYKTICHNI